MIPEFAIIGHPNEGKSSVLSTLAEDDSVRVSPIPGETRQCQSFPVKIDNKEILRFVDTPGFQNPRRMLAELRKLSRRDTGNTIFQTFINTFSAVPELADDCELLTPVIRGAGIIYVVDGSRPLRNVDKAEMEVLRLTGRPRMAILNCKDEEEEYLSDWQEEFRKNFNSTRLFNAHRATYAERILLLEALKHIDQEYNSTLDRVITAFQQDWKNRNEQTSDIIIDLLDDCLSYRLVKKLREKDREHDLRKKLHEKYTQDIRKKEKNGHERIRTLFKHNIFNYDLPAHSILHQDLFSKKIWHFLGLGRKQMLILGAIGGAAAGVSLDLATLGSSFGLFASVGGAMGAIGAYMSSKHFSADTKLLGVEIGKQQLQVGPNETNQFLFIILDRAFLFYTHIINWAHGRRDYTASAGSSDLPDNPRTGQTRNWPSDTLKTCHDYFSAIQTGNDSKKETAEKQLKQIIQETLVDLSNSEET